MVNLKKVVTRTVATVGAVAVGYGLYKTANGGNNKKKSDSNSGSSSSGSSSSGGSSSGGSSSSSSSKKSEDKVETPKIEAEFVDLEKPSEIYVIQANGSLQRAGLEIYTTDEANFKPYVSPINENASSASKSEDEVAGEGDVDAESESEGDSEEEDKSGFTLHQGSILDIYYFDRLQGLSFEGDYKDMSDSGTMQRAEVDLKKFYKGVRMMIVSGWNHEDIPITWFDMERCVEGFITEQTFKEGSVEIKVSGMTKLLDKKVLFKCTEQKRSAIIQELIKTAGLVPMLNMDGLDDDVTSFSNITEGKSSGGSGELNESTGSASIDEAVKKAISGKSGCLAKAKAIDKAFKSHIYYKWYYNVEHPNLDEAWKYGHLNCADGANVLSAMFRSAGIKAIIRYTSGHYIVKVTCNGKDYFTDCSASDGAHPNKPFGTVYGGTSGTDKGTKLEY